MGNRAVRWLGNGAVNSHSSASNFLRGEGGGNEHRAKTPAPIPEHQISLKFPPKKQCRDPPPSLSGEAEGQIPTEARDPPALCPRIPCPEIQPAAQFSIPCPPDSRSRIPPPRPPNIACPKSHRPDPRDPVSTTARWWPHNPASLAPRTIGSS